MAETIIDKTRCDECGFDVRENTQFCYNCGTRVDTESVEENRNGSSTQRVADGEAQAALDDLTARFKIEEPPVEDKLARAAEERKKDRVERRKPKDYTWEPV